MITIKVILFLSGIYTSGLSFYQAWVKRSFAIELNTPFSRWNSLELYGNDYSHDPKISYYNAYFDIGKDILYRTSMLQSIETYSHIDAIIRIKHNYFSVEKVADSFQYEGCYGVTGDNQDVVKTKHSSHLIVIKPIYRPLKFYLLFAIFLIHLGALYIIWCLMM